MNTATIHEFPAGGRVVADLDNGYLKTATEIQKAKCKLRVSPREWQVLEAVILLTYGWNKASDRVTNTYLAEMTGIDASNVGKALKVLASRKVVLVEARGHSKIVSINKVVSDWELREQVKTDQKKLVNSDANLVRTDDEVSQNRLPTSSELTNTINRLSKDRLSKDKNLCRAAARPSQPAARDELTIKALEVISNLNATLGSKYPLQPAGNVCKGIRARLAEGMTVDDLALVLAFKLAEWGSNPSMAQYLRPSTLYRAGNCQGYLQAAKAWDASGRGAVRAGAQTAAELARATDDTSWAAAPADKWW